MNLWHVVGIFAALVLLYILRRIWASRAMKNESDNFAKDEYEELILQDTPPQLRVRLEAVEPDLKNRNYQQLINYRNKRLFAGKTYHCIYLSPEKDTLFALTYFGFSLSTRLLLLACFSKQAFESHAIVRGIETHFNDDTLVTTSDERFPDELAWVRATEVPKSGSMDELFDAHARALNAHEIMARREPICIAGKSDYFELMRRTRARLAKLLNEAH